MHGVHVNRGSMFTGVINTQKPMFRPLSLNSTVSGILALSRVHTGTTGANATASATAANAAANARSFSRAWTDVPVLTESLCVLHLQVNLARLSSGLGGTSLLHPDDSARGITVRRSEQSLTLALRQQREANGSLRVENEQWQRG